MNVQPVSSGVAYIEQHTSSKTDFLLELVILALTSLLSSLAQDQATSLLILLTVSKLNPAQAI